MCEKTIELLNMCGADDFDFERAQWLIQQIDVNEIFLHPGWEWDTTLLIEATSYSNLKMVELLVNAGADPNLLVRDESPLWNMQYPCMEEFDEENSFEAEVRAQNENLRIVQLLLEHGADPCVVIDMEDLFSYVLDIVFNENDEYRSRFFIYLIAYGGKSKYVTPKIIRPFDKNKLLEYSFVKVPAGDGYHFTGEILDENHDVVAKV